MRKFRLVLLFIAICLIPGCVNSSTDYAQKSCSPEQTIRNHFKARNAKNKVDLDKTISEKLQSANWQLNNLDYIKLLKIEELDSENWIRNYPGKIKGKSASYSIKIFKVDYEVKYKVIHSSEDPTEGRDFRFFILVRKDSNSPWFIDSIGL